MLPYCKVTKEEAKFLFLKFEEVNFGNFHNLATVLLNNAQPSQESVHSHFWYDE